MEKAIFFEREDGFMHRCMFAGVDGEGNPQWVIINQVEEAVKSLTFEAPEDVIAEMKPNEREMFDSLYVCN